MSFIAVTNAQLTADQPITQALLRQFRDNIEGHDHSAGKGGTLVVGSFEEPWITGGKSADLTYQSTKVKLTTSRLASDAQASFTTFFADGIAVDDPQVFTLESQDATRWMIDYSVEVVPTGALSENALRVQVLLDGTAEVFGVLETSLTTTGGFGAKYAINGYLYLSPTVGSHTLRLRLTPLVVAVEGLSINRRQFLVREWRA